MPAAPCPIVVLISGAGSNLQAIIDAIEAGQINADIKAVISNRADAKGLEKARLKNIPAEVIEHTKFSDRQSFDSALQQLIDSYHPQLIVLAGFMRILTDDFVQHYEGRMLNIHPSLLPEFTGLNTHQRVLDAGCKQHGATVHFVTTELDSGPLIMQGVIDVQQDDTAESLKQRVHRQEHIIYPRAIDWFSQGRLVYKDKQVWLDGEINNTPAKIINNQLVD